MPSSVLLASRPPLPVIGIDLLSVCRSVGRILCLLAFAAIPSTAGRPVGVEQVIGMASRAMGFLGVLRTKAQSAVQILFVGYGFKVAGPDTGRDTTQMVEFQAFRDGAVSPAVSADYMSTALIEGAVAAGLEASSRPYPAGAKMGCVDRNRAVLIDLCPKAFVRGAIMGGHRELILSGVWRRRVNSVLRPSIVSRKGVNVAF